MTSNRYISYKFIYTDDLQRNFIKIQRVSLDKNNQQITPITNLFISRLVTFDEKITGTSQGLRHILAYINGGQTITKLPYASNDLVLLKAHIEEILAVPRVECGDYKGETLITGGISTSI